MKWVANLGLVGTCGLTDASYFGDWRLPSKTEWMAMVEYAKKQGYSFPTLTNGAGTAHWTEGDVFNNVQSTAYWSSTTYAPSTENAWSVSMRYGDMVYNAKSDVSNGCYVWPVRGERSGSFDSLIIE